MTADLARRGVLGECDVVGDVPSPCRTGVVGERMDFDCEVGVGVGSTAAGSARASAESADVSGVKRFDNCNGVMLPLRVVRCDVMRVGCGECDDNGCG